MNANPLTISQISKHLANGQNCSIFGMETSGHNTRAEEILRSFKGKILFAVIDARFVNALEPESLQDMIFQSLVNNSENKSQIEEYGNLSNFIYKSPLNLKFCILLKNTELALQNNKEIFSFLRSLHKLVRGKVWLVFSGNHQNLRSTTSQLENSNIFLENIFINLPYSAGYMEKIFRKEYSSSGLVHSKSQIQRIIYLAGGNPSILKGICTAAKSIKKSPPYLEVKDLISKSEVLVRLNQILSSFNEKEKRLLIEIVKKSRLDKSSEEYILLKSVGVLGEGGGIFSPLFEYFLKTKFSKEIVSIKSKYQNIVVDGKNVSNIFTKMEKQLLNYCLNKKGKIADKDDLFKEIWGDDLNKYSNWSLEQLVKRVRKKLTAFGLENCLLTVKERGLIWYQD